MTAADTRLLEAINSVFGDKPQPMTELQSRGQAILDRMTGSEIREAVREFREYGFRGSFFAFIAARADFRALSPADRMRLHAAYCSGGWSRTSISFESYAVEMILAAK